jgi:hypothetical protein
MPKAKRKAKTNAKAKAMKAVSSSSSSSSSSRRVLKKPAGEQVASWNAKHYAKLVAKKEIKKQRNVTNRLLRAAKYSIPYQPRDEKLKEVAEVARKALEKAKVAENQIGSVEVKATHALQISFENRDRLNERDVYWDENNDYICDRSDEKTQPRSI